MARDAGDQMTIDRLEIQAKNAQEAADRRGERLELADATIDQLEAQKADLLAALKEMLATFNRYTVPSAALGSSAADADRVREQARAAIERAS